jgi:HEAT repeat protein
MTEPGSRALKRKAEALLRSDDFEEQSSAWRQFPALRIINPLLSLLCSPDELVKWRAVTAIGLVVSRLADEDMESARVIMRRLMWSLTEESGGIGWGAPEAMGEIMASHEGMASEYSHILVSYLREDGNSLRNDFLLGGVLWGLGRLAQVRPHLLQDSAPYIEPRLESKDATVRGLAAWTLGLLGARPPSPRVQALLADEAELQVYVNRKLMVYRICDLAACATR